MADLGTSRTRYPVPVRRRPCGFDGLVDFDGSFWEGRSSIFGNDWIPADEIPDGDIGTIELIGHDGARYEASDGTWTLLSRVTARWCDSPATELPLTRRFPAVDWRFRTARAVPEACRDQVRLRLP